MKEIQTAVYCFIGNTTRDRPQIRHEAQRVTALGGATGTPKRWDMISSQSEEGLGAGSEQQRFIFLRKWNKLAPAHPI